MPDLLQIEKNFLVGQELPISHWEFPYRWMNESTQEIESIDEQEKPAFLIRKLKYFHKYHPITLIQLWGCPLSQSKSEVDCIYTHPIDNEDFLLPPAMND